MAKRDGASQEVTCHVAPRLFSAFWEESLEVCAPAQRWWPPILESVVNGDVETGVQTALSLTGQVAMHDTRNESPDGLERIRAEQDWA